MFLPSVSNVTGLTSHVIIYFRVLFKSSQSNMQVHSELYSNYLKVIFRLYLSPFQNYITFF